MTLTDRYARAVDYARVAHATQVRKGSNIPYMYHLLGVSSLVIEFGGDEDQAIGGLLHDVLEDCGAEHEPVIRAEFGDRVAGIVLACTDGDAASKAGHTSPEGRRRNWFERKVQYLAHLADAPDHVLLVSGADKLHNARAILQDLEDPLVGAEVFGRFTGGRDGTLGYYEALARIFGTRNVPMRSAIESTVARLHVLAGAERRPLHEVALSA
jgi:(p)ppGpp synthase/HD superfamily hydrolase